MTERSAIRAIVPVSNGLNAEAEFTEQNCRSTGRSAAKDHQVRQRWLTATINVHPQIRLDFCPANMVEDHAVSSESYGSATARGAFERAFIQSRGTCTRIRKAADTPFRPQTD